MFENDDESPPEQVIEFSDKAFDVFKQNDSREEIPSARLETEPNNHPYEDLGGGVMLDEAEPKRKKNLFGTRRKTKDSTKEFKAKKIAAADLDQNWFNQIKDVRSTAIRKNKEEVRQQMEMDQL